MTVSEVDKWFTDMGYTGLTVGELFDKWGTEGANEVDPPPPPLPPMSYNQVCAYIADHFPA